MINDFRVSATGKFFALFCLLLSGVVSQGQVPHSRHVYIVAEENRSYEHIVGSPDMPYLNGLLSKGALATQFYSNEHGSLENYFWVTAGQYITHNNSTTLTFNVDNVERHLLSNGLTFKSYAQSLPYAGFTGLGSGAYVKRHAPLIYFTDMAGSSLIHNHESTTVMTSDIANHSLPNFAFITPDLNHDIHNCAALAPCLQTADAWLKENLGPLLASEPFQPGGDGLLIIWADEADLGTDNRCSATVLTGCGGRIVVAMIGPQVKPGFKSTKTYHHPSVLRTMLEALGTTANFPAAAETAPDMAEFFKPTGIINVALPNSNTVAGSPVHMVATASASNPITAISIYVDNQRVSLVSGNHVDAFVPMTSGTHFVVFQAWDSRGNVYKSSKTLTVK
jgi:acid phosphatase